MSAASNGRNRSQAQSGANAIATVARVLIWIWLAVSLVGCGILSTRSTGGSSIPYVFSAIAAGLAIGIVATFMLTVVEYIIYKTTPD